MTDKQIGEILNSMTILVDTREQKNEYILTYFDVNGIKWKKQKLDSGDYSVEFSDKYKELNECVIVEKKNSLTEIAGNFTKGRDRFYREFERVKHKHKHLVIENATWKKVVNESYRSQMSYKSMIASIISFAVKYNMPTWFVGKDESPMLIYNLIYYDVRNLLKNDVFEF